MKLLGVVSSVAGLLLLAACQAPPPPDLRAEAQAAVRSLSESWSAAAQAKDAQAFASVYADGAVLMMANAPDIRGTGPLREAIGGMMQDPAFSLQFSAGEVVAARSGDIAYETGSYTMTMSGPDGSPVTESGHYVTIWQKQADGTWKVTVDAPVSDPS